MDEKTLLILRNEINSLDIEIISLLESRLQISKEIGAIKRKIKKDFFDKQRHNQILKKISEIECNYPNEDLKTIFESILETSLRIQKDE
jgi:chorismate mutase/prephenate dehydratase